MSRRIENLLHMVSMKQILIGVAVSLLFLIVSVCSFFGDVMSADANKFVETVNAEEGEEDADYSFYTMASMGAQLLNDAMSSDTGEFEKNAHFSDGEEIVQSVASAGSFMGYADKDKVKDGWFSGIKGFMQSISSMGSADYSYGQMAGSFLSDEPIKSVSAEEARRIYSYCAYGYGLTTLGLDKTGTIGIHSIRFLTG